MRVCSYYRGVHIVVATPGRLMDMLNKKIMNLEVCRYMYACLCCNLVKFSVLAQTCPLLSDFGPNDKGYVQAF